jgi:hypothetical protein
MIKEEFPNEVKRLLTAIVNFRQEFIRLMNEEQDSEKKNSMLIVLRNFDHELQFPEDEL